MTGGPADACAVVGCGNIMRCDDGAGVRVIEMLRGRGLPETVSLIAAGTGAIDALVALEGMRRAIIVDAARSDAAPGTVIRLAAGELERLPAPRGLNVHELRWDAALALGRIVFAERFPAQVDVFLVVVECTGYGTELSAAVRDGVVRAADAIADDLK